MWLKVAAIAALFVTDAVAQAPPVMQNCTTTVGNEVFRYCFDTPGLTPATRVFWNPAQGTPPSIAFAFEANGTMQGADLVPPVWRGVGFSNGPPDAMISGQGPPGSNVVMGCVVNANAARNFAETPAGADFELTLKNPAGVLAAGNQGLLTYNQQTVNNVCSVRFSRPVDIVGANALPMQSLGDRNQIVIVARGQDGDQGINNAHASDGRSAFPVNFANPANLVQPGPDMTTMTTMPGATMPANNPASTLSASMTLIPAVVGSIYAALW